MCPHCNKNLEIPNRAYINAGNRLKTVSVTTECCGKLILLRPVVRYEISLDKSGATEDDWGVEVR